MMFTKQWFTNLWHLVLTTAVGTFVGAMATSGAGWLSISAVHAALVSAGTAVFLVIQGAFAAPVSPKTSSTPFLPQAIWQRGLQWVGPGIIKAAAKRLAVENEMYLGHDQPPGVAPEDRAPKHLKMTTDVIVPPAPQT